MRYEYVKYFNANEPDSYKMSKYVRLIFEEAPSLCNIIII